MLKMMLIFADDCADDARNYAERLSRCNGLRKLIDIYENPVIGDGYDLYVTFFNASDEKLSAADTVRDRLASAGDTDKFITYYRCRTEYPSPDVYYTKKRCERNVLHHTLDFNESDECVFDTLLYIDAVFGEETLHSAIYEGKLCVSGNYILDLTVIGVVNLNPKLKNIIGMVKNSESEIARFDYSVSDSAMSRLNAVVLNRQRLYAKLDDLLSYYTALYKSILKNRKVEHVSLLNLWYMKEYFRTGNLSAIHSVFKFKEMLPNDSYNISAYADNLTAAYCSLLFDDTNEFVEEHIKTVFSYGAVCEDMSGIDHGFSYEKGKYTFKKYNDVRDLRGYAEKCFEGKLTPRWDIFIKTCLKLIDIEIEDESYTEAKKIACRALEITGDNEYAFPIEFRLAKLADLCGNASEAALYARKCLERNSVSENGHVLVYMFTLLKLAKFDNAEPDLRPYIADFLGKYSRLDSVKGYICLLYSAYAAYELRLGNCAEASLYLDKAYCELAKKNFTLPTVYFSCLAEYYVCKYYVRKSYGDSAGALDYFNKCKGLAEYMISADMYNAVHMAKIQYEAARSLSYFDGRQSYFILADADKKLKNYINATGRYVKMYHRLLIDILERFASDGKRVRTAIVFREMSRFIERAATRNSQYYRDLAYLFEEMAEIQLRFGNRSEHFKYLGLAKIQVALAKSYKLKLSADKLDRLYEMFGDYYAYVGDAVSSDRFYAKMSAKKRV